MDFETLLKKISPRLKRIAKSRNGQSFFIDQDDLYQEMCIHLWSNFKGGVPDGINEAYIVGGCEFHLLNYLRKEREKATIVSLEEPINEEGNTLEDILQGMGEALDNHIATELTLEDVRNNGLSKREQAVLSMLMKSYTVREIGMRLGISHVMVVKLKKRIIKKWQRKTQVTKMRDFLL